VDRARAGELRAGVPERDEGCVVSRGERPRGAENVVDKVSDEFRGVRDARAAGERVVRDRAVSNSPDGAKAVSEGAPNRGASVLRVVGGDDVRVRRHSRARFTLSRERFPIAQTRGMRVILV